MSIIAGERSEEMLIDLLRGFSWGRIAAGLGVFRVEHFSQARLWVLYGVEIVFEEQFEQNILPHFLQ